MRLTVGRLRQLINEGLTEPAQDRGLTVGDLKKVSKALAQIEEELGPVPGMLTELTKLARSPKTKAMFQKASGLGYHAMNDVRGMVAIIEIYLRKSHSR